MAGINKVIIVGNLGRDPEVRESKGGMAIGKLSVAVTERIKKGDTWEEATEWFRVTVFGATAENAAKYLQKGRQVYVEGRLKTEKYKDKDGAEKLSVEIVASTLQYLGGKGDGGGDRASGDRPRDRGGREPDPQTRRLQERAPSRGLRGGDNPQVSDSFIDDDLPY